MLRRLADEAGRGIPPGDRLVEGALVVVGGILLITPGVLTDLTGLLLILGPTRRWLAPRVKAALLRRIATNATFTVHGFGGAAAPPPRESTPEERPPRFDHPVA